MNKFKSIFFISAVFSVIVLFSGCQVAANQNSSSQSSENYTGTLIITEVGSSYTNGSRWFEVYNNSTNNVQLSIYSLRCYVMDASSYSVQGIQTFSLPDTLIYPGSYLVIRGKINEVNYNTGQIVYIANGQNMVPYWDSSGFIELVNNGNTGDFVSFGSDSTAPLTGGWNGGDAPALPYTAAGFGNSIVRNGANSDSDSASDWSLHSFSTPGGPNDVTSDADSDGDGIPDSCEQPGSTFAGLPLYDWGARAGTKDIFIYIDYMDTADPGVIPQKAALDKVVAAFAAHNIAVHFDIGDLYGSGVNNYNLDKKSHRVPFAQSIAFGIYSGYANLYDYKLNYMDLAKKQIFHYLLFAFSQNQDGSEGSSGVAELPGNDFIVTFGNWGLTTSPASELNRLINYQAATIMHELGHNLGLHHGGNIDLNYKPNFYSIMNYEYQLEGLSKIGDASEGDRYYFYQYVWVDRQTNTSLFKQYFPDPDPEADLYNGPTGDPSLCKIDYSDGTGADIDETNISESAGLVRSGSHWVDYDGNGALTSTNFAKILNKFQYSGSGGTILTKGVLSDYDDWSNLDLFFTRNTNGDNTGVKPRFALNIRQDKILDDHQNIIVETLTRPGR